MVTKQNDAVAITNTIANEIDIGDWVGNMSIEKLEVVKEIMTKYESNGHADPVIKLFAKHYPDMMKLEV